MKLVANTLLVVGTLWAAGAAHAQGAKSSTPTQGKSGQGKMTEFRGTMVPSEPKPFVERMLSESQDVVEEAQLAQSKSQSQQVKQFAQTLVQTHQQLQGQLKQFAKDQKLTLGTYKPTTPADQRNAEAEKAMKAQFKALSGETFDQSFLAAQVSDHDRMLMSAMAGKEAFSGQPLGTLLSQLQPDLSKVRNQAYQLLGQQTTAMGTGGAGTSGDTSKDKKDGGK
jgi:putative membrane protein